VLAFFPILTNTVLGVKSIDAGHRDVMDSLNARRWDTFWNLELPSALPYILTGMRIALGFSFMGIVAAELIGAREGIGFLIMNSQMLMQTSQLFVGLLTLGILGLIVDRIFRALLARSMRRYMQHHYEV